MAKAILNRAKNGHGYTAEAGRFTITPAFAPSLRGGSVTRPSHWIVKDTQSARPATEYPSLDRVRDMFRERRQLQAAKPAQKKPAAGLVLDTADGRQVRLTDGEITALGRYLAMNGTRTDRVQYDPGHVRYDTVRNLVQKGVFLEDHRGLNFLAPGVLEPAA